MDQDLGQSSAGWFFCSRQHQLCHSFNWARLESWVQEDPTELLGTSWPLISKCCLISLQSASFLYSLRLASPRAFQEEKQALVRSMLELCFWWHVVQSQSHDQTHLWERAIHGHEGQNVHGSLDYTVSSVTGNQHTRGHQSWLLSSRIWQSSTAFPSSTGPQDLNTIYANTSPSMNSCHLWIKHLIL